MINFLHLSALLSLTSALCLQRNAKKMNGANISPSFYSFFIFFSIFVLSCCFFLLFFPILFFFLFFFSLSFFLSLSLFSFVFHCVPILIPPFSVPPFSVPPFLFLLFLFLLFSVPLFFCSSFFCSSFYPFSEECDLQQKFHIDNVKHLPKFYAHFLKARFLFET